MRTAGLILTFNTIEHFVVPVVDLENYIYIILFYVRKVSPRRLLFRPFRLSVFFRTPSSSDNRQRANVPIDRKCLEEMGTGVGEKSVPFL